MPPQSLVTISEASQILGVSEASLRQWTDEGVVKAFLTPGGHRRYSQSTLKRFINSSQKVLGIKDLAAELADTSQRHREIGRTSLGTIAHHSQFDREAQEHLANLGRSLLDLIIRYLTEPSRREEIAKLAQDIGSDHGETLARLGLPLTDSVEAFTKHRIPIMKAATQLTKKGEAFSGRVVEAIPLVDHILNEALVALVAAHQRCQHISPSQLKEGVAG